MMKRIVSILAAVTVTAASAVPASWADSQSVKVAVNGSYVEFKAGSGTPFISEEYRTLVPLRSTAEAYGCQVSWDQAAYRATVSYGDTEVIVPINEYYVIVNGEQQSSDTFARIIDDRTYLPIRQVMEAVGATVDWDQTNKTVIIENAANYTNPLKALEKSLIEKGEADNSRGHVADISDETEGVKQILAYKEGQDAVYIYRTYETGEASFSLAAAVTEPYYSDMTLWMQYSNGETVRELEYDVDKKNLGEASGYKLIRGTLPESSTFEVSDLIPQVLGMMHGLRDYCKADVDDLYLGTLGFSLPDEEVESAE